VLHGLLPGMASHPYFMSARISVSAWRRRKGGRGSARRVFSPLGGLQPDKRVGETKRVGRGLMPRGSGSRRMSLGRSRCRRRSQSAAPTVLFGIRKGDVRHYRSLTPVRGPLPVLARGSRGRRRSRAVNIAQMMIPRSGALIAPRSEVEGVQELQELCIADQPAVLRRQAAWV
jgi:hypothetical protein